MFPLFHVDKKSDVNTLAPQLRDGFENPKHWEQGRLSALLVRRDREQTGNKTGNKLGTPHSDSILTRIGRWLALLARAIGVDGQEVPDKTR